MVPVVLQAWLSAGAAKDRSPPRARSFFRTWPATPATGPTRRAAGPCSQGLFGKTALQSGEKRVVDEAYVRESILTPGPRITPAFSRSCRRFKVWSAKNSCCS